MDEFLKIDLECVTKSPLVSGEIKAETRKQGVKSARLTGDNKAAIPIYGVLRGYLEIILRESGETVCDTGAKGSKGCGKCVLCDLFGYLGRMGRALVDDLKSIEDFKKIVSPSFHAKIHREHGVVTDSLNLEEIRENAHFQGSIRIIDPKERDLKLIKSGINAINEFGLGGWRTRGRGRVDMKIINVETKKWSDLLCK
jgi:CRISPR/Cas system CSM-associated protein Csm3 (group 7 of RAMP superfamily)